MGKIWGNLKIKSKLMISFLVVTLLTVMMGVFAIYTQIKANHVTEHIEENQVNVVTRLQAVDESFGRVRFLTVKSVAFAKSPAAELEAIEKDLLAAEDDFRKSMKELMDYIDYIDLEHDLHLTSGEFKAILDIYENDYRPVLTEVVTRAKRGDQMGGARILKESVGVGDSIQVPIRGYLHSELKYLVSELSVIQDNNNRSNLVMTIALVLVGLLSLIISILISNKFSSQINELAQSIKNVSNGDFSKIAAFNTRDEFGDLSRDIVVCADTVHEMVAEASALSARVDAGNIRTRIDVTKYKGEYLQMMKAVDDCVFTIIGEVSQFVGAVNNIAQGDFDVKLREFKGDKASINVCLNNLVANLKSINKDIVYMVNEASLGNLEARSDVSKYNGEWIQILEGLNSLLEQIDKPITEVKEVLIDMSKGDLEARVTGNYKGEFDVIKQTTNRTLEGIAGYISTIDRTLDAISNNDLTVSINTEFVGDFDRLKVSINDIILKLNEVFKEFIVGADEVAIGAQQISNSSISLADGATEQVTSLQMLTTGVESVSQNSTRNAESASNANRISEISKQNAISGDEQMKQMLVSMDEISQSSNEISKIIKVIEDIAFQTNLLALNAAVEAARAGAHGKGFAVVADEVRTLSARSSQAAKETAELIRTSNARVEFGSELAKATAIALDEIVKNVSEVDTIIEEISEVSKNQSESIEKIIDQIRVVEGVIVKTSAASEEGVSTAEELSSQSTVLRDLLATFKLKH